MVRVAAGKDSRAASQQSALSSGAMHVAAGPHSPSMEGASAASKLVIAKGGSCPSPMLVTATLPGGNAAPTTQVREAGSHTHSPELVTRPVQSAALR
jgi:hypothetical protein